MKLGNAAIQEGSIVADVKEAQRILTGQGYNVGPIDGIFGPQTKTAVLSFQKAKGLLPDGIIGPQTWAALRGQAPPVVPMTPKLPEPPPPPPPLSLFPSWVPVVVAGLAIMLLFKR